MLQNLPEGKTDKSYDKATNLRELKKNQTFVSNYYLHILNAHRKANCKNESGEFTAAV